MEEEAHPSTSRNQAPASERDDGDEESEKSYSRRDFDDFSDSSGSRAPPSEAHVPEVNLERVRSLNGRVSKEKKLDKRPCRQGRVEKRAHQRRGKRAARHSTRVLDRPRRQLPDAPASVPCIKMHQCPRCGHFNRYRR